MKEKVYHLTRDFVTELTPRIPKYVLKGEDKTTARICVSKSIEGAFISVPWSCEYYDGIKYEGNERQFIRVLEFNLENIPKENFIDTDALIEKKLVPDAMSTDECWIVNIDKIKPDKIFYILPQSMDYAYLNDHEILSSKMYSYLKIKEGYINEDFAREKKGGIFITDITYPKDDTCIELVSCDEVFAF